MCLVLLFVFKCKLYECFLVVINVYNCLRNKVLYLDNNWNIVLCLYVIKYFIEFLFDFLYLNLLEI